MFASDQAGRGFHQKLGQLVLEPYVNWKNALEDFSKHLSNSYHTEAVIWDENVLATLNRQKTSIVKHRKEKTYRQTENGSVLSLKQY